MKTLRLTNMLSTASLLLFVRIAPAQAPAPASAARPVPNLATQRKPPRDARITYSQGQLQVVADDSSLNLTILQIAHAAGIKVSGVAAEERIFGTYGPSTPAALLRILLQGTGTNMLITQSSARGPAELILTPQSGPPTPPQVHSAAIDQAPPPLTSVVAPATPANIPAHESNGQTEPGSPTAEPSSAPAPVPLTSSERALLVDRLQQQQRDAAKPQ